MGRDTLTVRLSHEERRAIQEYADFQGSTVSEAIRQSILEKVEDFEDARAYLEAIAEDDGVRYTHEEIGRELNLL